MTHNRRGFNSFIISSRQVISFFRYVVIDDRFILWLYRWIIFRSGGIKSMDFDDGWIYVDYVNRHKIYCYCCFDTVFIVYCFGWVFLTLPFSHGLDLLRSAYVRIQLISIQHLDVFDL